MGYMSYCRFEGTRHSLNDCIFALSEDNEYDISSEEVGQGIKMFDEILNYCMENEIIDNYNLGGVEALFAKHNAWSRA